jgi:hypothetical protein
MSRTGKIARIPREIRAQLNRRLHDGEPARRLLDWLNALPEVQTVLQRDFDSRKINEPNLSDWKQAGYREWLVQQEAIAQVGELTANADELSGVARGRMSDHLATMLTARYATEFVAWSGDDGEELRRKVRVLRELCRDVVELRRGDHEAARLQIEQARLDRERDKNEEEILQYFRHWLEYPKVRESLLADSSGPDNPGSPIRELLGVDQPENPETPSNPPIA